MKGILRDEIPTVIDKQCCLRDRATGIRAGDFGYPPAERVVGVGAIKCGCRRIGAHRLAKRIMVPCPVGGLGGKGGAACLYSGALVEQVHTASETRSDGICRVDFVFF